MKELSKKKKTGTIHYCLKKNNGSFEDEAPKCY